MGRTFYNPLINKAMDSDDEEFGVKSLDNVDLDRSFSPDEAEFTRNTIQNGLPQYDEETSRKMQELIKQNGDPLNPFTFNKTAQAIKNGTLEENPRMQALNKLRQQSAPQQLPQQLNDNVPDVNEPGMTMSSMKPTWDKREKSNQDLKNKEAIQNLFGNLKSKLK